MIVDDFGYIRFAKARQRQDGNPFCLIPKASSPWLLNKHPETKVPLVKHKVNFDPIEVAITQKFGYHGEFESIRVRNLPEPTDWSNCSWLARIVGAANQPTQNPHSLQVAMSTAVMQHPPTPPSNELQYGLHHIARHNAGTPLQSDWRTADYSSALPSQSDYASPGLIQDSSDPYINEFCGDDQYSQHSTPGTLGFGVQHPGSANQSDYLSSAGDALTGSPYIDTLHNTPMTPQSEAILGPRTRSGRSAARSDSPSVLGSQTNGRVTKPRSKKSRSSKAVNNKTPRLDAPLSELTKNMDVAVRDMVAWVNRSEEERHAEVEKRNGYITRPMNSFMLYRSAFAERTKQWCMQNNHQVVSSVSGESWPMEPESVRDHYNMLAKTERENHAKAHPEYKFSPSKTPAAAKKKRGEYSEEEEEGNGTESGDPDWEWRPRNGGSIRTRVKRQGREAGYPANNSTLNSMFERPSLGFDQGGLSGYPWSCQPRSVPPYGMDQYEQFNQYDPTYQAQPSLGYPEQSYLTSGFQDQMPMGMPHMGQEAMFQEGPHVMDVNGRQVDPTLLSVGASFEHGVNGDAQPKLEPASMGSLWEDNGYPYGGEDMEHWGRAGQM